MSDLTKRINDLERDQHPARGFKVVRADPDSDLEFPYAIPEEREQLAAEGWMVWVVEYDSDAPEDAALA